jgi:hypothetical protein
MLCIEDSLFFMDKVSSTVKMGICQITYGRQFYVLDQDFRDKGLWR